MSNMISLESILAPIPKATRIMMEEAKQYEKFAPPSIKRGLSSLGIGPMDYDTMKAGENEFNSFVGGFDVPPTPYDPLSAASVPLREGVLGTTEAPVDAPVQEATQDQPAQVNEGQYDPSVDNDVQQMFLALDDGTLKGAQRMVQSFEQIFDQYVQRTGRNMQSDLFSLQPGRQRETEYFPLNPGAY